MTTVRTLTLDGTPVTAYFSADGKRAVVASEGSDAAGEFTKFTVVDPATGLKVGTSVKVLGHAAIGTYLDGPVHSLPLVNSAIVFNSSGTRALVTTSDNVGVDRVAVIDTSTGAKVGSIEEGYTISLDPTGSRALVNLTSLGSDPSKISTVSVIDMSTGARFTKTYSGVIAAASFSGDGKRMVLSVVTGDIYDPSTVASKVRIYNSATGAQIGTTVSRVGSVNAVLNSAGTKMLMSATTRSTSGNYITKATLVNAATGSVIGTSVSLTGDARDGSPPMFSADGSRAYIAAYDKANGVTGVAVIDSATGVQVGTTVKGSGELRSLQVVAGGTRLALNTYELFSPDSYHVKSVRLVLIDAATGVKVGNTVAVNGGVGSFPAFQVSADGSRILIAADNVDARPLTTFKTTYKVIDASTATEVRSPKVVYGTANEGGPLPPRVFLAPNGSRVLVVTPKPGADTVRVYDATTGVQVGNTVSMTSNWANEDVQFSADGTRAMVTTASLDYDSGARNAFVDFVDMTTGVLVGSMHPTGDLGAAVFSGDGSRAILTVDSRVVTLKIVDPVNRAPKAFDDSGFTTAEDTAKTFTVAQLVGNDTDPNVGDKATLSVAAVSGAVHGKVGLVNGVVTFTPDADYNGGASFTYQVKDTAGAVSVNSATVKLTVTAAPDAPRAVADGPFTVVKDKPIILSKAQLVGNDIDADLPYGDKLKVVSWGGRNHVKTVVINEDGSLTVTPDTGYVGTASFIYRVGDSTGRTSTTATDAVVTLNVVSPVVNQAPKAVDDSVSSTVEDTAKTIASAELVKNDSDPDVGDKGKLSVAVVSGGVHGKVKLDGAVVTFTPDANYNGEASFTYKVKDAAGKISANSATVKLTVTAAPDAPRGSADGPFTVVKDASIKLSKAQLLGNDIDPDIVYGDSLTIGTTGGFNHIKSIVKNNDGSLTVTPETGYTGTASFIYRVQDSTGLTSGPVGADATVTLDVKAPATPMFAVFEPVTDNYKDKYNDPDNVREARTYLQIGSLKVNGITYTLASPPPAEKSVTDLSQIAVRGSDGSSGIVTMTVVGRDMVHNMRADGVSRYHAAGSFGPYILLNMTEEEFQKSPIKVELTLTVAGVVRGRTTVEYRYDPLVYNAAKTDLEYNGPGGQWWVGGQKAEFNTKVDGAP